MTRFLPLVILVCALAGAATAAASSSLTFTDLGTIQNPDGTYSVSTNGMAINAAGQAAGYARVSQGGVNPGENNAFSYSAGTISDLNLGGLDGAASPAGQAFGINDSGTIVGHATTSAGYRAFVTSGGSMIDLDTYDTTLGQSIAYGVNSSGAVVGTGYYVNSQWHALTYQYSGAYDSATGVYSGGNWSYTDVNTLLCTAAGSGSGGCSEALAVNNAGTTTGFATALSGMGIAWNSRPQAFVLNSAGAVTILPSPSGMDSAEGHAINAKGDVAGWTLSSTNGLDFPYLAVNGPGGYTAIDLAVPAGYGDTYLYGLNDYDMAVGSAAGGPGGAFLWTTGVVPFYDLSPSGITDLNALAQNAGLLPSGWSLATVRGINDAGQIVGTAADSAGTPHAFILSLPQALPGDANLDGRVDINDLTAVLSNYNQSVGMNWGTGDFTGSGTVDINDLTIVLAHYGQTAGTAIGGSFSAVPEPGALVLSLAGLVGLLTYAWRKRR
jgi:probable HAF family extracellular repeat protein